MPNTSKRRRKILNLIEGSRIANQAQLQELLESAGQSATQSQISRDLRALHVAKRDGVYGATERVTPLERLASLLRNAESAGPNLLVVRCEPGGAQAVARAIESEGILGMVGVVAGDDTLFAAMENAASGKALSDRIQGLVE